MKKWITSLFLFVSSLLSFGQDKSVDVLKFMGVPIDGTEYQVRMDLIRKGFSYNQTTKWFSGQFNGQSVRLSIHTNHRVVDRIYVRFPSVNKFSIKNEYNKLLHQLDKTGKYLSSIINNTIPEEENVADSISFSGKSYEACFYYLNSERDPDIYSETISLHRELLDIIDSEELKIVNTLSAQLDTLSDEDYEKHPDSKYIDGFIEKTAEKAALLSVYVDYLADGQVWFTIHEDGSKYHISLYYDNLHNRPHGEDL